MSKSRRRKARRFFRRFLKVTLNILSLGLLRKPIERKLGKDAADAIEAVADVAKKEL